MGTLCRITGEDFQNFDNCPSLPSPPPPDYPKAKSRGVGPDSSTFRILGGSKELPRLRATVAHFPYSPDLTSKKLFS